MEKIPFDKLNSFFKKNLKQGGQLNMNKTIPNLALGAWSWGTGSAGGDQVFGNNLSEENLQPVFDKAMQLGLIFGILQPFMAKEVLKEFLDILSKKSNEMTLLSLLSLHHRLLVTL